MMLAKVSGWHVAGAIAAAGLAGQPDTENWLVDPRLAGVVFAGLAIGAMIRAARLYSQEKPAREIRRDLIVSALVLLGNVILVLNAAVYLQLDYIKALGLAVLVGGMGLQAVTVATKWLVDAGRWTLRLHMERSIDTIMGERKNRDQSMISAVRQAMREEREEGFDDEAI